MILLHAIYRNLYARFYHGFCQFGANNKNGCEQKCLVAADCIGPHPPPSDTAEPSAASQHTTVEQHSKADPWSYRTARTYVSGGGGALHACGWKVLAPPIYTSVACVLHPHRCMVTCIFMYCNSLLACIRYGVLGMRPGTNHPPCIEHRAP